MLCVGGPVVFVVTQWANPMNAQLGQKIGIGLLGLFMLAVFGGIPMTARARVRWHETDLADGHSRLVKGEVQRRTRRRYGRTIMVGGEIFGITRAQWKTCVVGHTVEFYVAPKSQTLLDLRRLS